MPDTVGVSCELPGLDVGGLERRGWDSRATRSHKGGEVQQKVKVFVTWTTGRRASTSHRSVGLRLALPFPRSWESLMTYFCHGLIVSGCWLSLPATWLAA